MSSESLVCVDDYEKYALSVLPRNSRDFYKSGAGARNTLLENKSAFKRFRIRPRFLRDVSQRDTSTIVLGEKVSIPFGIAPTALQKMAHPNGEIANAKAAEAMGTVFILSTASTCSIEEVYSAAPKCTKWFQLYTFTDRNITRHLVERAEKAGYKALVLTVDLPVMGVRLPDMRNNFTLPSHLSYANFDETYKDFRKENTKIELKDFVHTLYDPSLNWEDLKWLKSITKLPIILKGILTAEDAILAAESEVAGIIVSNHGARQLDGTFSTIEVLEEIVEVVGDKLEVYLDGGIREGTDIFKALALGAKMVFIGRPALWGLTHDGEQGVKNILKILKNEFETTLSLTGCCSIKDIIKEMVVREDKYFNAKL